MVFYSRTLKVTLVTDQKYRSCVTISLLPTPHLLIFDASHVSHNLDNPEFTRHQQGEKKWPFGRTASVCKSVSKRI